MTFEASPNESTGAIGLQCTVEARPEPTTTDRRRTGYSGADLLPEIYSDLRRIAAYRLAREHGGNMLQETELIDEAWLRVCRSQGIVWDNEAHFFASICRAMRQILVDQARHRQCLPPIDDSARAANERMTVPSPAPDEEILAVDESLAALSGEDPAAAELVGLRFFCGFTQSQAAQKLGISRSSADRLWVFARAWLASRLLESRGR